MNKYFPVEPVNIQIQSLINMMQESNWVITTKTSNGKLLLFCGNVERLITTYGVQTVISVCLNHEWLHKLSNPVTTNK